MFDRLLEIISEEDLSKLKQTKVLIVGIGGVGGYALESLVRGGVENITIVDNDIIEKSNLNRQIIALNSNIGKYKTTAAKSRALDINPSANISEITQFIDQSNITELLNKNYDFIIDACDTITTKILLIKYALDNNIKIISCMGTGNRFNPEKLCITTINKTNNDPLAKVMRKLLKENNIKLNIPVVWSSEIPLKTTSRTPGSSSLVPAVAGIYLASYIINNIINIENK